MDDEVELYDVLAAMAESLVESQALFQVPEIPDRQGVLHVGGKPPREIFYRKTTTFATTLPPAVQPKRCTCKYLCTGAMATIKCFSCTIFDPTGTGFFCDLCFKHRHPWYRVPHMFADIDNDENIEYTLKVAQRRAEAGRYEAEGKEVLKKLHGQLGQLREVADDENVDDNIRVFGRRTVQLEARMRALRQKLRNDLRSTGNEMSLSDDEGAVIIQRLYKGYKVRQIVSKLYVDRIVRVWDSTNAREFFYDKRTGASSWIPPRMLLRCDLDSLEYLQEKEAKLVWGLKQMQKRLTGLYTLRRRHTITDADEAREVIRGFLRCGLARRRIIDAAMDQYRRVWDEEYQTYFYANVRTGSTSWNKPKIFLLHEPSVHLPEAADATAKRSPRLNRIKVH